jgi:hypothetical protein
MKKMMASMLIAAFLISLSTSSIVDSEVVQLILQIAALISATIGGYFAKSTDEVKMLTRKRGED